jgi:predicted AAA+ superfamily ATPase
MKTVADTLAGRAIFVPLPPLTWAEIEGRDCGQVLDVLLGKETLEDVVRALPTQVPRPGRSLAAAILAGGYPVPALSDDPSFRARWFDGYVQTYLERDLRDLSATGNLIEFRRLMQLCAAQNGRLLNMASLAGDTGVSAATVRRYVGLLETSFQIARVPAYAVNRGKRLVKAPRLLWTDTGLAAHLAGLTGEEDVTVGKEWGFWLENWVGIHLLVHAALRFPRLSVTHWRTADGREVDFVVEAGRKLLPVEVKATARPAGKHLVGLNAFLEIYPETPLGLVVCPCPAPKVLSSRVLALPVEHLLLG